LKTILITGGNSFLAKEFVSLFPEYNLIVTDRKTLDVTNKEQVDIFLKNNNIDYILHTAIKGGSRFKQDFFQDMLDNLNMYYNLSSNSDKYKIMFNFASGAEFDREQDIKSFKEEKIFDSIPKDFYGCSKNLISRDLLQKNNIINIRLFGCFGKLENDSRFIKNTIKKCLNHQEIIIQNKEMDFFYVEDLVLLIKEIILNGTKHKDINAVYSNKVDLNYIAKYIKTLTNSNSKIIIESNNKDYTGSSVKIDSLNLKFNGLENSIKDVINYERYNNLHR
jgi:UDP-glucose 4-epimerase